MRKAFILEVLPGQEEEYVRRHNPIWPELGRVLREHGVRNYSIFLHAETRQLFGYAEIESEARWREMAQTPESRRWRLHMREVIVADSDGVPQARPLQEVFHLE